MEKINYDVNGQNGPAIYLDATPGNQNDIQFGGGQMCASNKKT